MKGDFTRNTFDPLRGYSRVLMQQGRVCLDADYNEQNAILIHNMRNLARDIGGRGWGRRADAGFRVSLNYKQLLLSKGRYYVDGICCENSTDSFQFPGLVVPEDPNYLVYIDVWERHVCALQDPAIRETALGGPDTCTRAKIEWRIGIEPILEVPPTVTRNFLYSMLDESFLTDKRCMKAQVKKNLSDTDPCSIPPESRFRGRENQLYRIEIHKGGPVWNGMTDPETGKPAGNVDVAATFKWSRDNGSVVFGIVKQNGNVVTLQSLGQDERTGLKTGDWVEITDNDYERSCTPGIMAQVDKIDPVEMTITLKAPQDGSPEPVWKNYAEDDYRHPLVRRWDHHATGDMKMYGGAILLQENPSFNGGWLEIECGIEINFPTQDYKRSYVSGDYWLIPARVATGSIEWPSDSMTGPLCLPPPGVEHHCAPLAWISGENVNDIRCLISLPCDLPPVV